MNLVFQLRHQASLPRTNRIKLCNPRSLHSLYEIFAVPDNICRKVSPFFLTIIQCFLRICFFPLKLYQRVLVSSKVLLRLNKHGLQLCGILPQPLLEIEPLTILVDKCFQFVFELVYPLHSVETLEGGVVDGAGDVG